jgi:hypothetical protein
MKLALVFAIAIAAMPRITAAQDTAGHGIQTTIPRNQPVMQPNPPHVEKPPSSEPPSRFRQIYACDKKKPASASALGEIHDLKSVTVVGPNGKSAAAVKEILPNEGFSAGVFRGTRLELAPGARCSAGSLAILASVQSVEMVHLKEASDKSAIARVAKYLEVRAREELPGPHEDLNPPVYHTNYQIKDAKVFALPSNYVAVLANITYDPMVYDGQKYEKHDGEIEAEPMLFLIRGKVTELNKEARKGSGICDRLVSAFTLAKRLHIHVASNGCNNGINGQLVFDLSGPSPKTVFNDWDLSD